MYWTISSCRGGNIEELYSCSCLSITGWYSWGLVFSWIDGLTPREGEPVVPAIRPSEGLPSNHLSSQRRQSLKSLLRDSRYWTRIKVATLDIQSFKYFARVTTTYCGRSGRGRQVQMVSTSCSYSAWFSQLVSLASSNASIRPPRFIIRSSSSECSRLTGESVVIMLSTDNLGEGWGLDTVPGFTLMAGSVNSSSLGAGVSGKAAGPEGSFPVCLIRGLAGSSLSETGGLEGAVGPEGSCRDACSSVGVRLRS